MKEINIERNQNQQRLDELGVKSWSTWSKEPSEFSWYYDAEETCYFLQGDVVVTTQDGQSIEMGKGDLVVFPKGLHCVRLIRQAVQKYYCFS